MGTVEGKALETCPLCLVPLHSPRERRVPLKNLSALHERDYLSSFGPFQLDQQNHTATRTK